MPENTVKLNHMITGIAKKALPRRKSTVKNITYAEFLSDKLLIIEVIRRGIPFSLFSLIRKQVPFNNEEWAMFLGIHPKSLQRYEQSNGIFKPIHAEKIIEIAEVSHLGLEVFGTMEKFKLWLQTPAFSLGNLTPMELLRDSYGKEMVMTELIHINYGILA